MPEPVERTVWPEKIPPPEAVQRVIDVAEAYQPSTSLDSQTRTKNGAANNQQILARRLKAWELRVYGLSFRAIAKQLGIAPTTAINDVLKAGDLAKEYRVRMAERLFDVDIDRTEKVISAMSKRMHEKNDPRAAQALVHALEHRAKMLGHNAPEKIQHEGMFAAVIASSRSSLDEKLEQLRLRMGGSVVDVTPAPPQLSPVSLSNTST